MSIGTVCNDDPFEIQSAMAESDMVEVSESTTATVTIAAAVAGKRGAVAFAKFKSSGDGNTIQFAYGSGPTALGGAIELNDKESYEIKPADLLPVQAPEGEALKVIVTIAAGGVDGQILPVYNKVRGVFS